MRYKLIITLVVFCLSGVTYALEFKPFPSADITKEQWLDYYEKMKASFGQTEARHEEQGLATYSDVETQTQYAFTLSNHPAHPAWITRQVVQDGDGISISQIGYFAGNEQEFAKLFGEYQQLNKEIEKQFSQKR